MFQATHEAAEMGQIYDLDLEMGTRYLPLEVVKVPVVRSKSGPFLSVLLLSCVVALATGCGFHLNGSSSGSVTLDPASQNFGAVLLGDTSAKQKLTLLNRSLFPILISSVSTTEKDFAATSDCPLIPKTLGPTETCTVTVEFSPTAAGDRSAKVNVANSTSNLPATASVTGTGTVVPPGVSLAPASLSWTNITVGQTSPPRNVTLTNLASSPLTISSISVGTSYTVSSTTCPVSPATLAGGASCTIAVAFKPASAGSDSDTLTVVDSDSSSPQKVALTGSAVEAMGGLVFTPTSLTFATTAVGDTSATQAAVLTNKGSTSVTINSISATTDFVETNNCPDALAANSSCTVYVEFGPSTPGTKSGLVTVTYPSGSQTLSLSGTATGGTGGVVTLSPPNHTFPNQAVGVSSPPTTITLSNGQGTALKISSIQIAAPFSQTNNCGASLAAGSSCAIIVTYTPPIGGTNSANLIVTDGAVDSPQTAAIAGSAGQPIVSTIPAAGGLYFYNQIVLTQSSPLPVTVTNNQAIPLIITGSTSSADFPFTTDCVDKSGSGTLASNATCTIQVTFYPQVVGKRVASLTITHNAKNSPIVIPLTGTAIAAEPGLRVTVGPPAPCALPSQSQQFTATVTGTTNTAVTWYVNNVLNGNSSVGTITNGGLYTAPATVGSYSIKAISQASPGVYGLVAINVNSSPSFTIYPFASSIPVQGQQTFQPQICSAPDAGAVTWSVDNIPGGNSTVGTVSSTGVYTAPAVAGKHTVRVTEIALNKTTGAVVTVFSNIAVDFGSRTSTNFPVPSNMFGASRGESLQSVADRELLTQAGLTVSRLYGQIPLVYATQTPDWTKIDPYISSIQAAGQTVLLQLTATPPWLLPDPNPCGAGVDVAAPSDPVKWGQMAASYVAHMDATFPGVVTDYEIWNEPNASGLCGPDHLKSYTTLYAAAAPLMKQQAATDGATIHVGGPATAGFQSAWATALLSDPTTAPYVDFVSYHQYMFDKSNLQVQWDTYNGNVSMYQQVQDSGASAQAVYKKAYAAVKAAQPAGANTLIYITEFNTNWAFFKDCCRNDPTYAPIWNALYVTDLLDTAYLNPSLPAPDKLIYFAGSAYPWICMIGVIDPNLDCLYSPNSVASPYPQYYTYQLLSSRPYLGLVDGGYLANTVAPPTGGGGIAVAAFYNASKDAILITNPTAAHYSQIQVSLQNVGFGTPKATLYQIVNGALINSTSLALTPQTSGYTATIDIPPYSVQGIAISGP
jgi:Glycosyl hydrolases family 39